MGNPIVENITDPVLQGAKDFLGAIPPGFDYPAGLLGILGTGFSLEGCIRGSGLSCASFAFDVVSLFGPVGKVVGLLGGLAVAAIQLTQDYKKVKEGAEKWQERFDFEDISNNSSGAAPSAKTLSSNSTVNQAPTHLIESIDALLDKAERQLPLIQSLEGLANNILTFAENADANAPAFGYTQAEFESWTADIEEYKTIVHQIDTEGSFHNEIPTVLNRLNDFEAAVFEVFPPEQSDTTTSEYFLSYALDDFTIRQHIKCVR